MLKAFFKECVYQLCILWSIFIVLPNPWKVLGTGQMLHHFYWISSISHNYIHRVSNTMRYIRTVIVTVGTSQISKERKHFIRKPVGWAPKNWCFWTVVLEKTLESPLDCKEIQPVHSEGDQPWDFFGRNDVTAETPVLLPPHAKGWLIGKDSDAGRGWGQEEKGTTEDEMARWHHWLNGCESEWTPGAGDGQGGLACCDSWGRKESDTTEWLNWTKENC